MHSVVSVTRWFLQMEVTHLCCSLHCLECRLIRCSRVCLPSAADVAVYTVLMSRTIMDGKRPVFSSHNSSPHMKYYRCQFLIEWVSEHAIVPVSSSTLLQLQFWRHLSLMPSVPHKQSIMLPFEVFVEDLMCLWCKSMPGWKLSFKAFKAEESLLRRMFQLLFLVQGQGDELRMTRQYECMSSLGLHASAWVLLFSALLLLVLFPWPSCSLLNFCSATWALLNAVCSLSFWSVLVLWGHCQ